MALRSLLRGACGLAVVLLAPAAAAGDEAPQALGAGHDLGPARVVADCAVGASVPFDCEARAWLGTAEAPYALEAVAGTGGATYWEVALTRQAR